MINIIIHGVQGYVIFELQLRSTAPVVGNILCYLLGIHGSSQQSSPGETSGIQAIVSSPAIRERSPREAILLTEELLVLLLLAT